jgi:hypothetical protein
MNNRIKTETVNVLTIVKSHFKYSSCSVFFSQISKEVFLERVHESDKYSGESVKASEGKTYILFFLSALFLN